MCCVIGTWAGGGDMPVENGGYDCARGGSGRSGVLRRCGVGAGSSGGQFVW